MLENLKDKADKLMHDQNVQNAVNKAKDFINSEKGKETIQQARDKAEDLIADKTHGKGIFGFGKK